MTATLHKVMAGNGYRYYLRQVAAGDVTDRGRDSLADFYAARGRAPGRWWGAGLPALGIEAGDQVTEAQMKALFGEGRHPDSDAIHARVLDAEICKGAKVKDARRAAERATRLGDPYRVYHGSNVFRQRCAAAFTMHNLARGAQRRAAIPDEVRARIRTRVAAGMFAEQFGRAPLDARELSGWVTRNSRPVSSAVAALDITCSPVKSVSALWAVAPKSIADRIGAVHERAVDDAIGWLEQHGMFTRLGRNGVRQVDVEGIIAARFTHRESRCGDPDLHTHVLIANRVRTLDGRWRTLDSATIYRLVVTVSEIYNSRVEHHMEAQLGVRFAHRDSAELSKRPVREIAGVPAALLEFWSRRDTAITTRLGELAVQFQQQLGREPTTKEMFSLAERATLETRPLKHPVGSWAEQRERWRVQAEAVIGGPKALARSVSGVLGQPPRPDTEIDSAWIAAMADQVVETVAAERASWQWRHIRAETERRLRGLLSADQWAQVAEAVVTEALSPSRVIARGDPDIAAEPVLAAAPAVFARRSGASVYARVGTQSFTAPRRLDITARLIEVSLQPGDRVVAEDVVAEAIRAYNNAPDNRSRRLNTGQVAVVTRFARSPWRVETTNAPAGAGKTTAMRVLTAAWLADGGTVLGLAPTAAAAAVLGEATGMRVETVDKLLAVLDRHRPAAAQDASHPPSLPQWVLQIDAGTLVVVDEHVRLGDDKRLRLLEFLAARQATIRCVGDDRQLPSIEAGGTHADTGDADRAATLTHVVRFAQSAEASASLLVREGDPAALGFYLDHGRVHAGAPAAAADQGYAGWVADYLAGSDAIMLAPTHAVVAELNARARQDRLARSRAPVGTEIGLTDGLSASAGDVICTRRNAPRLRLGDSDWVRNGYRWAVTGVGDDGSIIAAHLRPGRELGASVRLPPEYVRAHVRLGYAVTIDSAQGVTADTCHTVVTGGESRNQLYVALTRGASANHVYVPTAIDGSEASFWTEPGILPRTATEVLQRILNRDAAQRSAHRELRDALDPHRRLGYAVDIYLDALGVAAENSWGTEALAHLDNAAEQLRPGLTSAAAYPVLRQHMAMIAVSDHDPLDALAGAIAARELDTADDLAAVVDWRLDPSGTRAADRGPLAWIPCPPQGPSGDPMGEHLKARARLITGLADQIRADTRVWTAATAPIWSRPLLGAPGLLADLAVWRAAHHIPDTDPRPTGPVSVRAGERTHQQLLDARVTDAIGDSAAAVNIWSPLVKRLDVRLVEDPWWPQLADRIDTAARAGLDIDTLLTRAAAQRPLPDDMPAAALWFRLDLDPSALPTTPGTLTPDWMPHLQRLVGDHTTERMHIDPAWARLVAAVDRATGTGWTPAELLTTAHELLISAQPEHSAGPRPDQLTTALAWRIEALQRTDTTDLHHSSGSDHREHLTQPTRADSPPPPPLQPWKAVMDEYSSPAAQFRSPPEIHRDVGTPLPAALLAVAELIRAGHITEAKARFHTATHDATPEQRDILERVATTLYQYSYPIAKARLRWAAEQYPQHRALIEAATPDTDPHTVRADNPGDRPSPRKDLRQKAARDHPDRIDPTPHRQREASETAAAQADQDYLDTRGKVDDSPHHLPLPEGTPHRYHHNRARAVTPPDGYALDYDRASIPDIRGLVCVHCMLERARTDSVPSASRRSDDGLCGDCRDSSAIGIPDHDPREHIRARCAYITATFPPAAAVNLLRRDWRSSRTTQDRRIIETWVRENCPPEPITATPAIIDGLSVAVDEPDPVRVLTDDQLAENVARIEQRLSLSETEAMMFGATSPGRIESTPFDVGNLLHSELITLRAEQHRRTHLDPQDAPSELAGRTQQQRTTAPDLPQYVEGEMIREFGDDDVGL